MLNIFGVGLIYLIFSQFTKILTKINNLVKTICPYNNYFKVNLSNLCFLNKSCKRRIFFVPDVHLQQNSIGKEYAKLTTAWSHKGIIYLDIK